MAVNPDYSVVVPGLLWVGSHPERSGPLSEVLGALRKAGVRGILTLTEEPLEAGRLEGMALASLHLPVTNYGAPSAEQLAQGAAFIDASPSRGGPTLVHCFAGIGRAGTMAAGYLIHRGASADDAIAEVRRLRHHACVESSAQRDTLTAFARGLR